MIQIETLSLLKEDFNKLVLSKNKEKKYEEPLKTLAPLLIEARKNGLSYNQICKVLKNRSVDIPVKFVREFVQNQTGEKRKRRRKTKEATIVS